MRLSLRLVWAPWRLKVLHSACTSPYVETVSWRHDGSAVNVSTKRARYIVLPPTCISLWFDYDCAYYIIHVPGVVCLFFSDLRTFGCVVCKLEDVCHSPYVVTLLWRVSCIEWKCRHNCGVFDGCSISQRVNAQHRKTFILLHQRSDECQHYSAHLTSRELNNRPS